MILPLRVFGNSATTKICRGLQAAENAKKQAETLFVKNELDIENAIKIAPMPILDLLLHLQVVTSKGEGRKLIVNKGVKIDDVLVEDPLMMVDNKAYFRLSVGKKKHFTLIWSSF